MSNGKAVGYLFSLWTSVLICQMLILSGIFILGSNLILKGPDGTGGVEAVVRILVVVLTGLYVVRFFVFRLQESVGLKNQIIYHIISLLCIGAAVWYYIDRLMGSVADLGNPGIIATDTPRGYLYWIALSLMLKCFLDLIVNLPGYLQRFQQAEMLDKQDESVVEPVE